MFAASKTATPSVSGPDAQFNYVTMLLHGDGTNGAQNNTFLDSSTNNFTITRNGNTTQGSFSPYGSNWSNYFDGSTSYLSVPSSSALAFGTGDFTVELWVNYYSDTGNYVLYDGRGTSILTQIGFVIYLAGGTLYAQQGTTPIVTTTSPTANTWHHIAFSRSGSSNKFFVDGTQVGTTVTDSTNYSTAYSVGIGSTLDSSYTSSYDLNGYLSNVRVVKGSAVYTSNFTPSTTPLTAISGTSLLTCQSNRFIDNSSNAFAITANGSPSVQRFNPFGASTAYSTSVIGGSGYFDGSGDVLTAPDNAALEMGSSDFTMEAWLYPNDSGWQTILTKSADTATAEFQFYAYNNAVNFFGSAGSTWNVGFYTGAVLIPKAWNHVAVTRSGSNWTIWVNGVSQATATASFTISNNTSAVAIGAFTNGVNYANGYFTDVRIVKGTAVYTTAFTPPTAPLTAITNTSLLLNFTNGAIYDNAMMNDLETVGNAQISTSVKKYGTGSLKFDGASGTYLALNNPTTFAISSGDFTIEGWLNASAAGSDPMTLMRAWTYDGTNFVGFRLEVRDSASGGKLGFYVQTTYILEGTYTANTWTHFAIVKSGSTAVMYINGVATSSPATCNILGPVPSQAYIGVYSPPSNYLLTGYLDDVRITKGYARYTANFTPPTAAFPNTGPT